MATMLPARSNSNAFATVCAVCALAVPAANAQSMLGRSIRGYPFADGFGHSDIPRRHHHLDGTLLAGGFQNQGYGTLDDYYGYRCPEYKPVAVSKWHPSSNMRLTATVALPGVHVENRRLWLGEDGASVHVRAMRSIPAQGGRRCLPRRARLSFDGRAEILDAVVPLPVYVTDASQVAIKDVQGGFELSVPSRQGQQAHLANEGSSAPVPRTPKPASRASITESPTVPSSTNRVRPTPRRVATLRLPPSDGVEIEEEDWPATEKLVDAAEGWTDNRGEFHTYGD